LDISSGDRKWTYTSIHGVKGWDLTYCVSVTLPEGAASGSIYARLLAEDGRELAYLGLTTEPGLTAEPGKDRACVSRPFAVGSYSFSALVPAGTAWLIDLE